MMARGWSCCALLALLFTAVCCEPTSFEASGNYDASGNNDSTGDYNANSALDNITTYDGGINPRVPGLPKDPRTNTSTTNATGNSRSFSANPLTAVIVPMATGPLLKPPNPRAPGTEISNSVIITGFSDFSPNINGQSMCQVVASNSAKVGAKNINFVVTLFGVGELKKLYRYYYKDQNGNMLAADPVSIQTFKNGVQTCFQAAVDAGFTTIHVTPHIDVQEYSTGGRGLWRNVVKFDPLAKYGPDQSNSFTYEDVLLQPVADALNYVVTKEVAVDFALSAESGLSVWSYPKAYTQLMQRTKGRITNGMSVGTGISFNYDKVCGCVEPEEKDPIKYNNTYLERFQRFKKAGGLSTVDVQGVRDLLDKSDFIGLSSYAPLPATLTLYSMGAATQTVAFELSAFGIDLRNYLNKPIIFSEQGLGGCSERGKVAPSLDFMRIHPFWGAWLTQGYSTSVDPWKVPAYRQYRRTLYRLLSQWAAQGGGPQYRVDGIFIWSVGTWDVQAVHPLSTKNGGTFGDDVISNYIKQGNLIANRLK